MHRELQLDHACERLRLPAGAVLHTLAGTLWLTCEVRGATSASADIVLPAGQRHRVAQAGDYFLTHLRPGPPVRCTVELPQAQGSRMADASARIQSATRVTSARGARSACSSQNP